MFECITEFFHRDDKAEQNVSLLRQKLAKATKNAVSVTKKIDVSDCSSEGAFCTTVNAINALTYWKDKLAEGRMYRGVEPHVMHSLSHSETVLQPGSAELFQNCRMHPLDELGARRNRNADNFSAARFLRSAKLKRTSA